MNVTDVDIEWHKALWDVRARTEFHLGTTVAGVTMRNRYSKRIIYTFYFNSMADARRWAKLHKALGYAGPGTDIAITTKAY